MQYVTITTAQALYAALGMSIFACILAIVLTLMAFVHVTGRWERRDSTADYCQDLRVERDMAEQRAVSLSLELDKYREGTE